MGSKHLAVLGLVIGCSGEPPNVSDGVPPDAPIADAAGAHDGGTVRDGSTPDAAPAIDPPSPWTDLEQPVLDVEGGTAVGPGGLGGVGGDVLLRSLGAIVIDPAIGLAPLPAPPSGGLLVSTAALAHDVTYDGTLRVSGSVRASGTDAVRVITATQGDLVVDGRLISADLGTTRQGLTLRAPAGTVFVHGIVDTRGNDGAMDGDAAGPIVIEAARVVIDGAVIASGEPAGGAGGAITIRTSEPSFVGGTIDTSGGDARGGGDMVGGAGGALTLTATGPLQLAATIRLRGGAATATGGGATGGAAGALALDGPGAILVGGIIDGRGGRAASDLESAPIIAGAASEVGIGALAPPSELDVLVPVQTSGGAGVAIGGDAGAVTLLGDGFTLAGTITGAGGATTGTAATAGDGAVARLVVTSRTGAITIAASGSIVLDGGAALGGGRGGAGGDLTLQTFDGDASMAGQLFARGGDATGAGSHGGAGGIMNLFVDANFDGIGGDLAIEITGYLDVSAGDGAAGGSARNDGAPGIALFPDHQEQIAVLLNSDGRHGSPDDGTLVNRGRIVALAGSANGSGGDVMFHGRQPGNDEDPLPGDLDLRGDGTGQDGYFAAE